MPKKNVEKRIVQGVLFVLLLISIFGAFLFFGNFLQEPIKPQFETDYWVYSFSFLFVILYLVFAAKVYFSK